MCKRLFLVLLVLLSMRTLASDFNDFDHFSSKYKTISNKEEKLKIYNLTIAAEKEFKIKKELMWALIATESSFRNIKTGSSIGYTQLQLPTAKWIWGKYKTQMIKLGVNCPKTKSDLYNSKTQILISTAYVDFLLKMFKGNLKITMQAYNAGISGYKKANNVWYYKKIIEAKSKIAN